MFHAYQKLYVGVFDDDGLGAHDDFAGRVVVDMARLRPNSVYDVFLPLRLYQNAFVKKSRGVIHLRLRVEWYNEKRALLSYLKRPTKTDQLGNAVTLNCADLKAFRNAVLTVQGKDVPGRYKPLVQKGLQREMKLYKTVMKVSQRSYFSAVEKIYDLNVLVLDSIMFASDIHERTNDGYCALCPPSHKLLHFPCLDALCVFKLDDISPSLLCCWYNCFIDEKLL